MVQIKLFKNLSLKYTRYKYLNYLRYCDHFLFHQLNIDFHKFV